jgi:hypothetical protein
VCPDELSKSVEHELGFLLAQLTRVRTGDCIEHGPRSERMRLPGPARILRLLSSVLPT